MGKTRVQERGNEKERGSILHRVERRKGGRERLRERNREGVSVEEGLTKVGRRWSTGLGGH